MSIKKKFFCKIMLVFIIAMVWLSGCDKGTEQQLTEQMELGQKYLEEMDYENAIVAFQKAIEIDPKAMEAYEGLADAYIALDQKEEALDILAEGLDTYESLSSEEKTEAREAAYGRMVDKAVGLVLEMAGDLRSEGNYKEALELLETWYERTNAESLKELLDEIREEMDQETQTKADIPESAEAAEESEAQEETDEAVEEEIETSEANVAETIEPETVPVETTAAETVAPETIPPETTVPETAPSETAVPETTAAETAPPETAASTYTLNITTPLPSDQWGTYHLSDAIGGMTNNTTIRELEAQIPGLQCELFSGKDDEIWFYKDGIPLFYVFILDCFYNLSDEEWMMIFLETNEIIPIREDEPNFLNALKDQIKDRTFDPSTPIFPTAFRTIYDSDGNAIMYDGDGNIIKL